MSKYASHSNSSYHNICIKDLKIFYPLKLSRKRRACISCMLFKLGVSFMSSINFPGTFQWSKEAKAKLKNIPFFVRSQARAKIEEFARKVEQETITPEFMEQARLKFGQ